MPKHVKGNRPATARKSKGKSEQRPPDDKARLASIVDSSDDAIIGKSLDGTITSWNKGAERIYGYRAEEMIGKNIAILAPPDRQDEIRKILEKIRRGERLEHHESVRVRKDKRRLNVSITISPLRDDSGRIIGASAIARDITAMQQAREALQESESTAHSLFQSAAQAIFMVNASGQIVMANPAAQTMFGYSAEELIGKPVDQLVPQSLQAGHKAHRDRFFARPQVRPMGLGLDLQAQRKDGREFFVEISLSYIQSAQGTWAVAFVTDISKRRADEQALRQQGEDLRSLAARLMTAQDDERRRIARDLHDDLSQKVAFLAMDLGKLATKPSAQELLPELRPLQLRAAEVAEGVRRISHQLHPSVLDDIGLEAALEQYCEEFQSRSGIITEFASGDIPDPLPKEIASSLYHIAKECLRNVAKHSRAETVSVEIECSGGVVRLTVKDRGVGLSRRRPESGRGIGIVAMQERAHLVNGRLSIQSAAGAGTEVRVEVPLSVAG